MTQEGGQSTAKQPFVVPMAMGGLAERRPETVATALEQVHMSAINTDGDDMTDVAELQVGRDPNISAAGGADDAIFCPPEYGCAAGARIASRPPLDGSACLRARLCGLSRAAFAASRLTLQAPPAPAAPLAPPVAPP